jgi:hypothetical protein
MPLRVHAEVTAAYLIDGSGRAGEAVIISASRRSHAKFGRRVRSQPAEDKDATHTWLDGDGGTRITMRQGRVGAKPLLP